MTEQEDRAVPGQRNNRGSCVADVMTTESSRSTGATYAEIVTAMLTHDVSGLPVLGADGRLLGMVTEVDLIAKEVYRGRAHRARCASRSTPEWSGSGVPPGCPATSRS